ncbi:MAG: HEAT repeat domain-containing protein [Ignavibacterium sp.]|jgi:hypothetical protein|nr:HEAT repeat domain-containing protein [Ignavibacterium sp.]
MNHNECKELMPFYLYEELNPEKKKLFEDHLKSCKDCANELESYKNLFDGIVEDSKSSIDPKLLLEARLELRGAFRAQWTKVPVSTSITDYITSLIYKHVGLAISGLSVMLLGLFIGYLIFNSPVIEKIEAGTNDTEKLSVQNINFIDSDPSDGQVEFTFDAVKSGRIKGNVNDSEIQKILTYAVLNEQNPGTRLNSINVINANQIQKPDDEIKSTLIAVAKFDNNPGVRIEALKSLNKLPADEEIKNTLIYVLLNDTSSGIRIEAINSLVGASKSGASLNQKDLMLLRDKIQTENNSYIRFQAKNIIKEY